MGRYIKPIGGEFWFQFELFNKENNNFINLDATFLNGGLSALRFIINESNLKNQKVLLPSYLCPSILYTFIKENCNIDFYNIKSDFSIDIEDLKIKIDVMKPKSIYVIDYFGFYHNDETINFIRSVKKQNIIIIEDAVQMLWFSKKNFFGDYVFNSYRKFLPLDGSIVLSDKPKKYEGYYSLYDELVYKARILKTLYNELNIGNEEEFLYLFELSKNCYYEQKYINGMNDKIKFLLSHIDIDFIENKRKSNYRYLYQKLRNAKNVYVLFNLEKIKDNIPIGFPILINNRDYIRLELMKDYIFCPIHWDLRNEYFIKNFKESKFLSEHILTIPIDNRYNEEDLDRLISKLLILTGGY